jgi:hypothetical protein
MLAQPSFEDALAQCEADHPAEGGPATSASLETQQFAVALASKHGGKLISSRVEALALLRTVEHNVYSLFDEKDAYRGWAMFPGSSFINHSCYPNAVGIAEGGTLAFETLRELAPGEEILQCYTSLKDDRSLTDWGFVCDCPRCTQAHTPEGLATFDAFDAEFRCSGCDCVTTSRLRQAAADACGVCQCNSRNLQNHFDARFRGDAPGERRA